MDIVAALLVEGDAGGKVQRVALLLTTCAQQHAGRADLLGVVGDDVTVLLGQQLIAGGGLFEEAVVVQHPDVATLCREHFLALCIGGAVRKDGLGHGTARGRGALVGQNQHIGGQL